MRSEKIICIDLESTTWENDKKKGAQIHEIIEIGVCLLNIKDGSITNKTSYLVRPKVSKVSKYCTKLTSITPQMIKESAIPFKDACNKLAKEFGTKSKVWASWGFGDRLDFAHSCKKHEAHYPFGESHVDVQLLFSLRNKTTKNISLMDAVNFYNLDFQGRWHRGDDDAYNTGRVLWELVK